MPIRSNKRVHEFEWEFAPETSEQEDVKLSVIYHDTDEFGPTVSIIDETGEPVISVPRSFFTEVGQELDEEDLRRNPRAMPNPVRPITVPMPGIAINAATPTGSLPLPTIERKAETVETEAEVEETPVEVPPAIAVNRDPALIDNDQTPAVSFSRRSPKVDPVEQQEIIAERGGTPEERAAVRARKRDAGKQGIKRLAKTEAGDGE